MRDGSLSCKDDWTKNHFWMWVDCDGTFCKYVCMDCGEIAEERCVLKEEDDD